MSVRITRSHQRLNGRSIITDPKTSKGIRLATIPASLCLELEQYARNGGFEPGDKMSSVSRGFLAKRLKDYATESNLQSISVHELRHSHASLLINLGYSLNLIADRLGHGSVTTTQHYTHLFLNKNNEIAERLDKEMLIESCFEDFKTKHK